MILAATDKTTHEPLFFEIVDWEREFLKAVDTAPEHVEGERWVSLGQDGNKHPVLLHPIKGHEGSYRVAGGAGGKLNGLRLNGIKSPEAYRQESLAKAKEKRAAEKAELAKLSPEERQQKKAEQLQAQSGRREAERQFATTVLGPEPEIDMPADASPADITKIVSQAHRERLKLAFKTAKDAEKKVLLDAETRMASGLATSFPKDHGALGHLNVDDLVTQKGLAKGPGYQRPLAEMAEKNGLTAEALAAAVDDIKERAALEAGKPLPPKSTPPGAGIAAAGAGAFDANQQAQAGIKELQKAQTEAIRKAIEESIEANENLGQVLKARAALRDAYREAATKATGRVFEPGFQTVLADADLDQIVDTLEDQYLTGHVRAFLDEVERAHPAEEYLDLTDAQSEEGLHATRGAAAFDALHEVALATLGQGCINRDVVEVLGPEGAAIVTARAIRQAFTHEDQKQILQALQEHHVEEQKATLASATQEASELRQKAHSIETELATTPKDLALAAEMTHNKLEVLKEARRVLGGTLGRLEARAALIHALRQPPQDAVTVPMGKLTPQRAVQTAAALGLKQGDYKIDHALGEATLTVTGEGQDRLIAPVDQAGRAEREMAIAIKKGQLDDDGYLPQGFSRRTDSRYDNPLQEPPALQTQLQVSTASSPQEIKTQVRQHIGSRLAEGQRPGDILHDLEFGNTAQNLGPEMAAQVAAVAHEGLEGDGASGWQASHDQLVKEFMESSGIPGDSTFHGQSVNFDHPDFRESLHRTLAEDPRTRAAHIPVGELSTGHESALKDYYLKDMAKVEEGSVVDPEAKAKKLEALGPEPDKFDLDGSPMDDLGMDPQPSAEWKAWDSKRRQIDREHDSGARAWKELVNGNGGQKGAYGSIQSHMAESLAQRFAKHYQDVTGTKLRLGDMGGRQGLGMTLEGQIRAAMPGAAKPFEGMTQGVKLGKGVSMSGKFIFQQRASKAFVNLKRMGLYGGAGSGKTPIMLGGVANLKAAGKLKKCIMAVPSVVQAQFGSEAAKFLDPNAGINIHARPGETFEQRLAAYKDPDKHAVVVTHQSLRDDTLRILGKHRGLEGEALHNFVMQTPKPELAKAVKDAFAAEGIDYNAMMVDEAHNILSRKGKEDAVMTRLLDAHGHAAEYHILATGNPLKNDASEVWGMLNKTDPQRYPEDSRDEFLRRYGVDTPLARRSMKQEISRYFFADRVHPGVGANHQNVTVDLGASQKAAIDEVERASSKLRTGDPDTVKWAKILAPEAFKGKDETQHADIAERVKKASGTFREAKLKAIINAHPTDNAKITKAVELAQHHVGKGEPTVIFSHSLQGVDATIKALQDAGLKVASLTGADTGAMKEAKAAQFMGAPGKPPVADVFVLSDAAATGLNLQRGKALIHMDTPDVYLTYEQRCARIHRLGQNQDVSIYSLMADHPFERKALERMKRKEQLTKIVQDPSGYTDDQGFADTLRRVKARAEQDQIEVPA